MNKNPWWPASLVCACCLFLASCSGTDGRTAFDLAAFTAKMQESGWSYLETLGEPGKSETDTFLASKTSRTVTAYWVANGVRAQKVYQQTDMLYAVATHQKSNGDTFSIVFKKPKT